MVSAPAGFGTTTLLSEWTEDDERRGRLAWLSLDRADDGPVRFLTIAIAALRSVEPRDGEGVLALLHLPQPQPVESILTTLISRIGAFTDNLILVPDEYHVIESQAVDRTLTFLLEHLSPQMHLVVANRTDPSLPLSWLRKRGQMVEARVDDLRFTPDNVADYLTRTLRMFSCPSN